MFQVSVSNSVALFILLLTTLVFRARKLFSHFISPLLDTCFNSWYLSDLLLFIPSLFSRACPFTLILLHAVFHTLSPTLPVSPSLSLTSLTCIHISLLLSSLLSLFLAATGVMVPYILRQLINGLPGDSYNTPASLFCQSRQVPNFITTLPTSGAWLPHCNPLSIWQ